MPANLVPAILLGEALILLLVGGGALAWAYRRERRRRLSAEARLVAGAAARMQYFAVIAEWARQAEAMSTDLGHGLEPVGPSRFSAGEPEPDRLLNLRQAFLEGELNILNVEPAAEAAFWQAKLEHARRLIACFDAAEQAALAAREPAQADDAPVSAATEPEEPDADLDAARLDELLRDVVGS